jgi:hypothetical protein
LQFNELEEGAIISPIHIVPFGMIGFIIDIEDVGIEVLFVAARFYLLWRYLVPVL